MTDKPSFMAALCAHDFERLKTSELWEVGERPSGASFDLRSCVHGAARGLTKVRLDSLHWEGLGVDPFRYDIVLRFAREIRKSHVSARTQGNYANRVIQFFNAADRKDVHLAADTFVDYVASIYTMERNPFYVIRRLAKEIGFDTSALEIKTASARRRFEHRHHGEDWVLCLPSPRGYRSADFSRLMSRDSLVLHVSKISQFRKRNIAALKKPGTKSQLVRDIHNYFNHHLKSASGSNMGLAKEWASVRTWFIWCYDNDVVFDSQDLLGLMCRYQRHLEEEGRLTPSSIGSLVGSMLKIFAFLEGIEDWIYRHHFNEAMSGRTNSQEGVSLTERFNPGLNPVVTTNARGEVLSRFQDDTWVFAISRTNSNRFSRVRWGENCLLAKSLAFLRLQQRDNTQGRAAANYALAACDLNDALGEAGLTLKESDKNLAFLLDFCKGSPGYKRSEQLISLGRAALIYHDYLGWEFLSPDSLNVLSELQKGHA